MTIQRKKLDPNKLFGVIVGQDVLVLLHEEYDFQFDGYTVIRRRDVTDCYACDSNDYGAAIMRREGLWEPVPRAVKQLPLDSWAALLERFVGRIVILENERRDYFYIGRILAVDERGVSLRYFDGCGHWQEVCRVPHTQITLMRFGDRYSTLHAKYLKGHGGS